MSGYHLVLKIKRLEEECDRLGFQMCHSKHNGYSQMIDQVALKPKDDCLPIYARDAELFVGTLNDLESWLQGVKWARDYDSLLRISSQTSRGKKEQQVRNEHLLKTIKDGKLVQGTASGNTAINSEDC